MSCTGPNEPQSDWAPAGTTSPDATAAAPYQICIVCAAPASDTVQSSSTLALTIQVPAAGVILAMVFHA